MSNTEIIAQKPTTPLHTQPELSVSTDSVEIADTNRSQTQEILKKSQPQAPEQEEHASPTKVSVQSETETDKENTGVPQTSSNSTKLKSNSTNPAPEDLLRRLQEKANTQFPENKRVELSSNATNQINNIMNMLGKADKNTKNLAEAFTQSLSNTLLGSNTAEGLNYLLMNNYHGLNYQNVINGAGYSLSGFSDKQLPTYISPPQEKNTFYKDQMENLPMVYQTQSQILQSLAANQENSPHYHSDSEDLRKGRESGEKINHSKNLISGQSSESKLSNGKDGQMLMIDESSNEASKLYKDAFQKKKRIRICLNRLCLTDPNDNSLWSKQKVKNSHICKFCFDAYKKHQYCMFCYQIYLDQEGTASSDDKDWIGCDQCGRWNHIDCEQDQGLKTIKMLVDKDKSFKYFCPNCRAEKQSIVKPGPKRAKGPGRLPGKTSYQKQQVSYRRTSVKSEAGQKEIIEEKITMIMEDEGEEVINKKMKIAAEGTETLESPPTIKEVLVPAVKPQNPDFFKQKLDSMLNRANGGKKRYVVRSVTTTVLDNYNDIDKLMNQYSGNPRKKLQLSENEIREDLNLFRELCKNGLFEDKYHREDDYGNQYNQDDEDDSQFDEGRGNGKGKGRGGMKFRKSRKGKGKNFYAETDLFYLDGDDDSESNEGQTAATGNRKKNTKNRDY